MRSSGIDQNAYFVIVLESSTANLSEIVAIAPFILNEGKFSLKLGMLRLLALRLRRASLLGNDLLTSKAADDIPELLIEILRRLKADSISLINLDCLKTDAAIHPALIAVHSSRSAGFRFIAKDVQPLRAIDFDSDFDDYLGAMSKKVRYNFKRTLSQFEKKTGVAARMVAITEASQVPGFLSEMDIVFKNTWQAAAFGYSARCHDRSLSQHKRLADGGLLRCYVLYNGEHPIAFIRGYQYAGIYYYEEIGFDKNTRNLEPGTVLNFLVLQDLFARNKPRHLDFGFGENDYKRKLGNTEIEAIEGFLVAKASKAHYLIAIQALLQRVYKLILRVVKSLGIDTVLRKLLKRR